jgi:Domain of unknown function (DU1801)
MSKTAGPTVAEAFAGYPPKPREKLLELRDLILATAAATPGVGALEECLKWGEPAFLTSARKSGSTIRIAWKPKAPQHYAMYFNCNTGLISSFRILFPDEFRYEGNRAIIFHENDTVPVAALSICIAAALTYHLTEQQKTRAKSVATNVSAIER